LELALDRHGAAAATPESEAASAARTTANRENIFIAIACSLPGFE